jgi:hypothetical protein
MMLKRADLSVAVSDVLLYHPAGPATFPLAPKQMPNKVVQQGC